MKERRSTRVNPKVIVVGDFVAVVFNTLDNSKHAWVGEVISIHDAWIGVRDFSGMIYGITRGQATRVA